MLLLFGALPISVGGQAPALTGAERSSIDSLMADYRARQRMPALSVAIGLHGEVVFAKAIGLADIENGVAATPLTKFRAASTQKAMTATAVLQLVRRGRIDLDGDIRAACPEYPPQRSTITVRQLLLHQGGVRGSDGRDVFSRDHYASVTAALSRFARDSLIFAPGASMLYSNYGYVLLACAIEHASGTEYDAYLRSSILGPAGMTSTGPVNVYRVETRRAASYVIRTTANTQALQGLWTPAHLASSPLDEPFPADLVDPSFEPGAGNYWSTPTDLVRFAIGLEQGKLLAHDAMTMELEPQPAPTGTTPRTMGWVPRPARSGGGVQIFGSDWNGSFALVEIPSRRLSIAIASNINWDMPTPLVNALLAVIAPR